MPSAEPGYTVLGRGRWAATVTRVLTGAGRRVGQLPDARRGANESAHSYRDRIAEQLAATGGRAAWLCVPPGEHVDQLAAAALDAGLDVVVEKPWTPADPVGLAAAAGRAGRVVAVHFEYCLLDGVTRWRAERAERAEQGGDAALEFSGGFQVAGADRLGLPAALNLGSHLLAIREYAVPTARLGPLACGYDAEPMRWVALAGPHGQRDRIDFTDNHEPIIQRFLACFEAARDGAGMAFDIAFAARVAATVS